MWVLGTETDKISANLSWYLNDSNSAEDTADPPLSNVGEGMLSTTLGTWTLASGAWSSGSPHKTKGSMFDITSEQLAIVPLDSRARFELDRTVPDGVTEKSTLHLIHNTASYWNSDKSTTINGTPNTYDVGVPKFGTVKTYHDTLSELGFESKLYDGSATSADVTLTESGGVWTHTTAYGTWTIDNKTVCEAATAKIRAANCYDVEFAPNVAAINNIENKIVKLDLVTSISGGSVTESDTISYIIVGDDIQIALDDNITNIIDASSATTFSNVDGTLTTTKQSGDTFEVEVKETEDNAGTYTAANSTIAASNSDAGFSADRYDLTLGNWYFADSDTDAVAIPGYTSNSTVSRKLRFDPDDSAITGLSSGEVRYSTITVKTMRSSNEISRVTFTVAIYRTEIPIFTISAVDTAVNEGESVTLKVTTDTDPAANTFNINYTPTNIKGSLSTETSITESAVTFTADAGSSPQTWSKEFEFQLRSNNSEDEENGVVSVKLDRVMDALTNVTYATNPNNTATIAVKDLTVPVITFTGPAPIEAPADAVFTFTATPKPWQPLAIRYKPTNQTGNFLDTTDGASGVIRTFDPKLTFTDSGNNGTATLNLSTIIDTDNASGEISVEILSDLNTSDSSYNISATPADNTKTVSLGVTYPSVSLEIDQTPITVTEGGMATITVIANMNPVRTSLPITITAADATGTYLSPSVDLTPMLTGFLPVSGGPTYSATFSVATKTNDGIDGENGSITVTLANPAQGANYTLGTDTSITFAVIDDNVPLITIENAPNVVLPNAAQFTLSADIQPREALTIRYKPKNTTGNFLEVTTNGANDMPRDVPTAITFAPPQGAASPITGILMVPTITDASNDAGTITVELLADSNTTNPTYQVGGTDDIKTVNVFKYPIVELSIEAITEPVTEGDQDITITVTASENPMRSIPISFTPTDTTGTYLAVDLLGNGHNDPRAEDLTFTNTAQSGSPEVWQATFDIDTKADDNTDAADGEIKVKLDSPAELAGYTVKADPDDHVDITIIDATKPIITIGTADPVFHHGNINNNVYEFRHDLVLVSNIEPHAALNVKYSLTETGTDFLRPSNPNNRNFTFTAANPATNPQTYTSTLAIELKDDVGEASGTYTLTLQEDANNYTLRTGEEKTKSFTVNDPSYIRTNTFGYGGSAATFIRDPENIHSNDHDSQEVFLYITDPTVDFTVTAAVWVLGTETDKISANLSWYLNDSNSAEDTADPPLSNVGEGMLSTTLGTWTLASGAWSSGSPHKTKGSMFDITSEQLAIVPLDSRARFELDRTVPDGVTEKSTLHLIHNTASYWNSDKSTTINGTPNTYDVGVPKFGTVKTYHDTLSELGFESKLYDGSATSADVTLTESGGVWTHTTAYGTWTIDNKTVCEAATAKIRAANCYDVEFAPNVAAINNIENKIVKLDLVTSISGGSVTESDTISYIIVGDDIQIALEDNNTNIIDASSATTFSNVDGTLTTTKQSGDTFEVEVKETD